MTDGGRDQWIRRMGQWLSARGFEGDPVELGIAFFCVRMKLGALIEERHPGHGWAKPGSLALQWAYAYSKAEHSPEETWGEALAKEIGYADAEARGEAIPVLRHDRRKNRRKPLHDPDVPRALEPVPVKRRGRPLAGLDPLLLIHGLHERDFRFPAGLVTDEELEQVQAFATRSDEELQADWRVKPAALRKRRNRLRKRMSQISVLLEGGSVEAPTIIERLARVEERVREHDRQLGLVPDDEAEAAVESLLDELADEQRGGKDS
jgi:hypothetical protein